MKKQDIEYYYLDSGEAPFLKWFSKLDMLSQQIVDRYIVRLASSEQIKNVRSLKDGVFEVKIYHGSGLRVYFAYEGEKIIILLLGGDKGTQDRDISKAKKYWREYAKKK